MVKLYAYREGELWDGIGGQMSMLWQAMEGEEGGKREFTCRKWVCAELGWWSGAMVDTVGVLFWDSWGFEEGKG